MLRANSPPSMAVWPSYRRDEFCAAGVPPRALVLPSAKAARPERGGHRDTAGVSVRAPHIIDAGHVKVRTVGQGWTLFHSQGGRVSMVIPLNFTLLAVPAEPK